MSTEYSREKYLVCQKAIYLESRKYNWKTMVVMYFKIHKHNRNN